MAKKTRKTAQQIAAELIAARAARLGAVGMQPEAAALAQHDAVEVVRTGEASGAGKKAGHDVAKRQDAFDALKDGMAAGAFDAGRRLERDLLVRRGEGDKGQRMERVDCEEGRDLTDQIVQAGEAVDYVKARLSRRDFWLLHELLMPGLEREGGWRGHVFYVTGETNWNAQGACVRAACLNLRDAYEEMDNQPRRAAA